MKYACWIAGAILLICAASCSLFNPTANQVTIEVSNQSGSSCPVTVELDGNNALIIPTGSYQTFPTTGPGSHTFNFTTGGNDGNASQSCVFTNNGSTSFNDTFNTTSGNVYVGTIKANNGSNAGQLTESGP